MKQKRDIEVTAMYFSAVMLVIAIIVPIVVIFLEADVVQSVANVLKNILYWGLGG